MEEQLINQPDSYRLNSWLKRLLVQREKLMLFNQKYWDRFKRKERLVNGDRNSRFFQQLVKTRRKRNAVLKLKDECGVWLDTQQAIVDKLVADYTARFSTNFGENRRLHDTQLEAKVTTSENITLLQVPTREEIKQALFSIDSIKTPGPDGYDAGFFKKYWDIIQNDFQASIIEFFTQGKLLRQINHTFIALIPKIDDPTQTQHFRPISLCSTIYKTIAKIIVNRLRPLLDRLVSPVQSAFIPGRLIHDNILITTETMHKFRKVKGKTAWVALKLDMKKAYDRLEWDFIKKLSPSVWFP